MSIFGEYICSECGAKYREDHLDGVCVPSYSRCQACRMEDIWERTGILVGKVNIQDNRQVLENDQ